MTLVGAPEVRTDAARTAFVMIQVILARTSALRHTYVHLLADHVGLMSPTNVFTATLSFRVVSPLQRWNMEDGDSSE
jgi:hypothetical protein